jgi:FAD/FMN-containing dehydrogenases
MNIQAPRPPMGPLIEALKALLGDRLSVSAAVREQHGHDESYHATLPPDAVAFAQSTAEVADIMRLAPSMARRWSLRHRHLAGRPCGGDPGRHQHRSRPDEQDHGGQ